MSRYSTIDELNIALAKRLQHAVRGGEQLATAIQTWHKANPAQPNTTIADDRLSWQLAVTFSEPPPFDEFGHLFGDVLSNLRAILNNMVAGIADVRRLALVKPKLLQFPIAETRKEWRDQSSWIAELPEAVRLAIEQIQPFQREGSDLAPHQDLLMLLRRQSNEDKHRLALLPTIDALSMSHFGTVEFASDEDAAANVPPDVTVSSLTASGDVVLLQRTTRPIVSVRGSFEFDAQVVVMDPPYEPVGVTASLASICSYVPQVCEHVLRAARQA